MGMCYHLMFNHDYIANRNFYRYGSKLEIFDVEDALAKVFASKIIIQA